MDPGFLLILALIALASNENSKCSLNIGDLAPKMILDNGINNFAIQSPPEIVRKLSNTAELYCANGFTGNFGDKGFPSNYMQLKCGQNGFTINMEGYENFKQTDINCVGNQSFVMYESHTALPDCEDFMTLVVGFDFGDLGMLKNIAICYNVANRQILYISYTAYPTNMIQKVQAGPLGRLGLDVRVTFANEVFKEISTLDITNALRDDEQLNQLLDGETFEYQSLIQDKALKSDLNGFEKMLSIVWLRCLRDGNWKHFLEALEKAELESNYDVQIGVSGIVNLPGLPNCNETRQLTIDLANGETIAVPALIWAHIRGQNTTRDATNEFVVIAHNSPYSSYSERRNLCNSMCQEIHWLTDTRFIKLQHNPNYGLVQCCRTSEIAHKLDHFPKFAEIPLSMPSSTESNLIT